MEDKELIIKAKNGDKEAIEKIIIQYEPMIRKKSKGYSYEKISEKLGKNIKSIDNTMCRIRKKIKGGI